MDYDASSNIKALRAGDSIYNVYLDYCDNRENVSE